MTEKFLSIFKKTISVILVVVLALALLSLAISLIKREPLPKAFGFGGCIVISGSMEPTFSIDDFIFVKEQKSYEVGDVVVYSDPPNLIVHRVVWVSDDGKTLRTRGDANNADDAPIDISAVQAKVIFSVPKIGVLVSFIKSPFGIVTVVLVCYIIFSISNIIKRLKNTPKEENEG